MYNGKMSLSIFLSIFLVFQLLTPGINSLASGTIEAPKNFIVNVDNTNDVSLKWDEVTGASFYRVYRIYSDKKQLVAQTRELSWKKLGVEEGIYSYAVATVKDSIESLLSIPVNFEIIFPEIQAPLNIEYILLNTSDVQLKWSQVTDVSYYKVYEVINGTKKLISQTANTYKAVTGLSEGEHTFEVAAVNSRFGESVENNQIKFSIIYPDINSPQDLTATISNSNDINLEWLPVENATSYNIYQIVNNQKKFITKSTSIGQSLTNLPEGEYEYEVSAVSSLFGESKGSNRAFASIVFPEVKAPVGLTAKIENGNNVSLTWEPALYASSYKIFEVINGEKKFLFTRTATNKLITDLTEGMHVFEVSTVSDRFGESTERASVEIEVIYPEMNAPEAQIRTDKLTATITWTNVDFANSYNVYKVVNGEIVPFGNTDKTSTTIADLPLGTHEFYITALNEKFGESPLSNIVVADISPLLDEPIAEEPEVNGDNVDLVWSPVSGADSYNIYEVVDGQLKLVENTKDTTLTVEDLPPGDHEFRIVPVSPSGVEGENYSTVVVKAEQFDTTPPLTVANETVNWNQGEYQVELTATDDQSGVDKTYYSLNGSDFVEGNTVTISEEGTKTIYFYSVDKAGNKEDVKTTEVKIDNTPPETISNIPLGWNNEGVTVNLTATDELSGVAKTFYSVNGSPFVEGTTFNVNSDGIHQVAFYSVDNAGNKEDAKTEVIKIDSNAPVTVSDITDEWKNGEVTVKLTATDDLSGVAKTFYSLNGTDFVEGTSFTINKEGINTVYFYSVDNAGNVEAVKSAEVKIDKNAPVTLSDITDGWNKGEVPVNLTASDDRSGVAATFYSVNGSEFVKGTEFTVSGEGKNKVSFYSVDNAGNVEEVKTVELKIDKTAPETVSNIIDQWNKGDVPVNLTATDNLSGVAKTYYSINDSDFVEGNSFNVSQEGINKVKYYSVDNAGNVEEIKSAEVKIDKTAPVVTSNLANEYALGTSLPLNYKATDLLSGIAQESITVNGKVYKNGDTLKLSQPGTYKVVIIVTDKAGWKTTIEKSFITYIPAKIVITPGVIKQNSGEFTVRVDLPCDINTDKIDLNTANLNGVAAKKGTNGLIQQAKNGQFKFNRDDFNWSKGMVKVEFRVLVDGYLVVGSTTVEVK